MRVKDLVVMGLYKLGLILLVDYAGIIQGYR
jgi:hypothetical protein